jgi:hypothetical protein
MPLRSSKSDTSTAASKESSAKPEGVSTNQDGTLSISVLPDRLRFAPENLSRQNVLHLQRTIGNRAVIKLLAQRTGPVPSMQRTVAPPLPASVQPLSSADLQTNEAVVERDKKNNQPHTSTQKVLSQKRAFPPIASDSLQQTPAPDRESLSMPGKTIRRGFQLRPQASTIQRFVDPAVTAGLTAASTRDQIMTVYHTHVWSERLRVTKLLESRPDIQGQSAKLKSLHEKWEDFANGTSTTDGRAQSPIVNPARALTTLNALLAEVNSAEDLVMKTPLPDTQTGKTVFGTEFTFTEPGIHGIKIGVDDAAMKMAVGYIKKWQKPKNAKEVPPDRRTKSPQARMFVYQIDELKQDWWWILDVDDGCLETQTKPISIDDVNKSQVIQSIIDKDIFGEAKNQGLAPHALVGGGHLSLDSQTTFGNSAVAFRNFIVAYTNNIDLWRKMDADFINAPFVQELPIAQRKAFVDVIGEFDVAYNGPIHQQWTIERLVDELMKRVFTFVRTVEAIGSAPHYQATNLEHMQDKNPSSQRIEMRRFAAQESLAELLYTHLARLQELIEESRDPKLIPLKPVDTTTKINADRISELGPVDVAVCKEAQKKLQQAKTLSKKEQKEFDKASLLEKP